MPTSLGKIVLDRYLFCEPRGLQACVSIGRLAWTPYRKYWTSALASHGLPSSKKMARSEFRAASRPGAIGLSFQEWRLPAGVYLTTPPRWRALAFPGEPLTLVGASTNRVVMTLKGDGGSVQGTVSDRNRRGIPKAGIVLLSVDDRRDDPPSYRLTAANERGEFAIDGVRPDSYLLFAFDLPVDESALRNRAFVTPYLMLGRKLEVKKGEQVRVDLDAIVRP